MSKMGNDSLKEVWISRGIDDHGIKGVYAGKLGLAEVVKRVCHENLGYLWGEREEAIYEGEELTQDDTDMIMRNFYIDLFEVEE